MNKKLVLLNSSWVRALGLGILLYLYFLLLHPYGLFLVQENSLFLWTWGHLVQHLERPGNFSLWVSGLIDQFYYVSFLGCLGLTFLLVIADWLSVKTLKLVANVGFSVSLIPLFFILLMFDISIPEITYTATVFGICLSLGLFLSFVQLSNFTGQKPIFIAGFGIIALLISYWLSGGMIFFLLGLLLIYYLKYKRRWKNALFFVITAVLSIFIFSYFLTEINPKQIWINSFPIPLDLFSSIIDFFDSSSETSSATTGNFQQNIPSFFSMQFFFFMIVFLLLFLCATRLEKYRLNEGSRLKITRKNNQKNSEKTTRKINEKTSSSKYKILSFLLMMGMLIILILTNDRSLEQTARLDYLSIKEDWKTLVEESEAYWNKHESENELPFDLSVSNFTKLGLIMSRQLNNRYFHTMHYPKMSSLFVDPMMGNSYFYARLYYYMGDYSNAFHTCSNQEPGRYRLSVQLLRQLIPINLAMGNSETNEVPLSLLEKTLFHKKFAKHYRKLGKLNVCGDKSSMGAYVERGDWGDWGVGSALKFKPNLNKKIENMEIFKAMDSTQNKRIFMLTQIPDLNFMEIAFMNSKNFLAGDYNYCLALLRKDLFFIWDNLTILKKIGYSQMPTHIEEAMLIYLNYNTPGSELNRNTASTNEFKGFRFNPETCVRYEYFLNKVKSYKKGTYTIESMTNEFRNTYWLYYYYIDLGLALME